MSTKIHQPKNAEHAQTSNIAAWLKTSVRQMEPLRQPREKLPARNPLKDKQRKMEEKFCRETKKGASSAFPIGRKSYRTLNL